MNDELIDILKQTDAASYAPRNDETACERGLADRVVAEAGRRIRRRRTARSTAAVFAIVALLTGLYALAPEPRPNGETIANGTANIAEVPPSKSIEAIRAEIEALDRDAAAALALVDRLKSHSRLRRFSDRLSRIKYATQGLDSNLAAESAAQTMLLRGDRLATHELTQRLAPAAYRRVIEIFPQSAAADDAQRRLSVIAQPQGDHA